MAEEYEHVPWDKQIELAHEVETNTIKDIFENHNDFYILFKKLRNKHDSGTTFEKFVEYSFGGGGHRSDNYGLKNQQEFTKFVCAQIFIQQCLYHLNIALQSKQATEKYGFSFLEEIDLHSKLEGARFKDVDGDEGLYSVQVSNDLIHSVFEKSILEMDVKLDVYSFGEYPISLNQNYIVKVKDLRPEVVFEKYEEVKELRNK